jgi:NitT/TauT family transport system substrate-binding protein
MAAGGAAAFFPRPARSQAVKLRIAAPFADSFGTPFYIKDAGTFAKAGFDVDVSIIPAGAAVIAALAGNGIELGVADLVSASQAIAKGVPIAVLAPCGLYVASDPLAALYVAKDAPIRQPRDLEGRTIGLPQLAGLTTAALRSWLTSNGVDLAKVKFVEVPSPSAPAAIIRGTIDASVLGEPFITPVKTQIRDIGHPLDAIAKEYAVSAWFGSRPWLEADRARSKRVVDAIFETSRWANTHRTETLGILARDGKMDLNEIRTMVRTPYGTSLDLGQIQPVLNAAERFNFIDKALDANSIVYRA